MECGTKFAQRSFSYANGRWYNIKLGCLSRVHGSRKDSHNEKDYLAFLARGFLWHCTEGNNKGEKRVFDATPQSVTYLFLSLLKRRDSKIQSDELAWDSSKISIRFTKNDFECFVDAIALYLRAIKYYRQVTRNAIKTARTLTELMDIPRPDYEKLLVDLPHDAKSYKQSREKEWQWEE